MSENMDVLSSLRKIANELVGLQIDNMSMNEIERHLHGAAFMIKWIADGLEHEFTLAAERGRRLQQPALGLPHAHRYPQKNNQGFSELQCLDCGEWKEG